MNKRRNLTIASEGLDNALFVENKENNRDVYIVSEKDYMNVDNLGSIQCQVLEYEETDNEIIYRRKEPELFIPMQRSTVEAIYLNDK